jgi:uncharacterized protein (TIGR02246 family)
MRIDMCMVQDVSLFATMACLAVLLAGCTVSVAPGDDPGAKPDPSVDEATIRALSDARAEAFRQGDAAAIAKQFAADGYLMAPGEPKRQGPEQVQAYYQKIFDEFETDLESGYEEVAVGGDIAWGRGFAKVTLQPRDGGPPQSSTAKYVNTLRRQPDGSWITTHDIWNANE